MAERDRQEQIRDRRRETFFGILAVVLGGPSLVLSFLGAIGPVSERAAVVGSLTGIVVGAILIVPFLLWLHRR